MYIIVRDVFMSHTDIPINKGSSPIKKSDLKSYPVQQSFINNKYNIQWTKLPNLTNLDNDFKS
jgi:hypothetical protein